MGETPYGNAQWATQKMLRDAGFVLSRSLPSEGVILGKVPESTNEGINVMHQSMYDGDKYKSRAGSFLSIDNDGHIITVAPTRSGKGVGLIIPNLLNYRKPIIVIDPKGENYEATSDYRVETLNHQFWCFDPYRVKKKDSLHGIATLKRVKKMYDSLCNVSVSSSNNSSGDSMVLMAELSRIAESIVIRQKHEKDPFFNDASQTVIKNALLIVLYIHPKSKYPPCSDIYQVLSDGMTVNRLAENAENCFDVPNKIALLIHSAAREIKEYFENRDVKINTLRQIEFLQDDDVRAILDGNPRKCERVFDPESINGDVLQSIYLIIPPQYISRQARLLRLFVTITLDVVMRRSTSRVSQKGYHRYLFVLDEIAQLGYLDSIQKSVALAAGYGVALWMFWQDISQLRGIYPEDWETFLSNAKIQQYFGCNDSATAKYISERAGPRTQYNYTEIDGWNFQGVKGGSNHSVTVGKMAGELVRPSEVLRADNKIIFTFCQGLFPFLCERICYYENGEFLRRSNGGVY